MIKWESLSVICNVTKIKSSIPWSAMSNISKENTPLDYSFWISTFKYAFAVFPWLWSVPCFFLSPLCHFWLTDYAIITESCEQQRAGFRGQKKDMCLETTTCLSLSERRFFWPFVRWHFQPEGKQRENWAKEMLRINRWCVSDPRLTGDWLDVPLFGSNGDKRCELHCGDCWRWPNTSMFLKI